MRDTAPGAAWGRELAILRENVLPHVGPGDRLVVAPIGSHSYTDSPVLDLTLESASAIGSNPLQLTLRNRNLLRHAYAAAVRGLANDRSTANTEIIAATMAAADRFGSNPGAAKVLILDSTGYEQSSLLNMADVRQQLDADTIAQLVERIRRANELPRLDGMRVCVAGISAGEGGWAVERRIIDVRAFWQAFFRASGATLVSYGTTPEGCLS